MLISNVELHMNRMLISNIYSASFYVLCPKYKLNIFVFPCLIFPVVCVFVLLNPASGFSCRDYFVTNKIIESTTEGSLMDILMFDSGKY